MEKKPGESRLKPIIERARRIYFRLSGQQKLQQKVFDQISRPPEIARKFAEYLKDDFDEDLKARIERLPPTLRDATMEKIAVRFTGYTVDDEFRHYRMKARRRPFDAKEQYLMMNIHHTFEMDVIRIVQAAEKQINAPVIDLDARRSGQDLEDALVRRARINQRDRGKDKAKAKDKGGRER